MKLLSVNLAVPRTVKYRGQDIPTGIFKEPVSGPVDILADQLQGDLIADRRYHGGGAKSVYAYSADDYEFWREQLGRPLGFGAFGENLTISGFSTADACVGDVLAVGAARLQAVQPREPCYKLGLKFEDNKLIKRFLDAERWGVYFRVLTPGPVAAGDAARWETRDPGRVSIVALGRVILGLDRDPALRARVLALETLDPSVRGALEAR